MESRPEVVASRYRATLEDLFPLFASSGQYLVPALLLLGFLLHVLLGPRRREARAPARPDDAAAHPPYDDLCTHQGDRPDCSESEEDVPQDEELFKPYLPKDLAHVKFGYERPTEEEMYADSLAFYTRVNARRTMRYFSADPVPREVVLNIIKAAGTSPSGAHTEPWTFVLVSNPEVKASIRDIVEREEEFNYKKRMSRQWTTDLQPLKTDWHKEYLTVAPYLILVFRQDYAILPDGRRKIHYYKELSVALACGILITAIHYAGLVTLTSTPLNCGSALRDLLGRPLGEKLVLLLPVGYPAEDATVPDLKRKKIDEILVEIA